MSMAQLAFHRYKSQESLQRRIQELRAQLDGADLARLADLVGASYHPQAGGRGELNLVVMETPVVIVIPELVSLDGATREPVNTNTQALLLYHLCSTNGAPVIGRWVSFRELPDGGFYHQAFQGYTGREIAKRFQNDLGAFERAASQLGGQRYEVGDAAYTFRGLPRVPVLVVYWLGDEDFPPSARILFDASAGHHLPIDACALLGSTLTRHLIGSRRD